MSRDWAISNISDTSANSNRSNLTYRPSINLQGYTCCGVCRLKPGMICICILVIIMTSTQFLYLHINSDIIWLWIYFAISILFSILAMFGTIKYLHCITRLYTIWLFISIILTLIDEYLFGEISIIWYIVIGIMLLIRIYFIYVVWKYSKIVSLPFEKLHRESSGL